jgi:hypothetical protein
MSSLNYYNYSITMTNEAVFTKKVACSGQGYLSWIPKNVVDLLSLSEESYVEVKIRKLEKGKDIISETIELTFVKRVAKSGRGFLLWIPKDVSDYLQFDSSSYCEITLKLLGERK